MKAMRAMAAMPAMKTMKKKKVSKIARGKLAKAMVFRGSKEKTISGLKSTDFMRNSQGKIVSKKASAHAKKVRYLNIKPWIQAVQKARKALGIKGFAPIKKGTDLYKKAKEFF